MSRLSHRRRNVAPYPPPCFQLADCVRKCTHRRASTRLPSQVFRLLNGALDEGPALPPYRQPAVRHSCGAAALATLLKYDCGIDIPKTDLIRRMMVVSTPEVVVRNGFSMLDMKKSLETIGLRGRGFRVNTDALYHLQIPVMVLMNLDGYEHFVIVKHAQDGRIFIAAPALGNGTLLEEDFAKSMVSCSQSSGNRSGTIPRCCRTTSRWPRGCANLRPKGAGGQIIAGFVLNVLSQWQLPNGAKALAQGPLSVARDAANALTANVNTLARVTDGHGNPGADPNARPGGRQHIAVNRVLQVTQVAGDRNPGFNTATIDFNNHRQLVAGGTRAQSAAASNTAGNVKADISLGNGGVTVGRQTPAGIASQTIAPGNAQQAGAIAQLLHIAGNNQQVANQLQISLHTAPISSAMLRQAGVLQALQNAVNARR
ncbi:peptidase C39 bacteriocin processing [Paraburkholderia phymatum STM815]|uniref:Peptidase C39 bacteriocin processing n=1 Tax=Paraburkholderia phymatum (strain DSM 17167 / CIP 108236 / LMG 21445 / STM815) TaxID=391038 RepID=B2JF45_PARP8|nr:peptidase C39 bacteriocin processing [Paraburkholderia phymatum STM815]